MLNPIYIFDIDGTLADCRHRMHHIKKDKDSGKRNWKEFFFAAKDDPPYPHTLHLNRVLYNVGATIYLITGRPENLRKDTEKWLAQVGVKYNTLLMRPANDRRPDYEAKKDLFLKDEWLPTHKDEIKCVFEDRLHVAKMWRDLDLHVCVCGDDWLEGDWSK